MIFAPKQRRLAAALRCVLVIAAVATAKPAPSMAAPDDAPPRVVPAARQHAADAAIERGRQLLVDGQFDAALQEFLLARDMAPAARVTAHLAQAERALHHWVEAEQHLTETLASPSDPWVQKNRPLVEKWLREVRDHVGGLRVTGTPFGAKVKINGEPVELLPFSRPLRLVDGRVKIQVSAPGYASFEAELEITPDHIAEVDVHLVALSLTVPPASLAVAPTPAPRRQAAPSPLARHRTGLPAWLGVGLIAAGVASLAGGAVLLKIDGQQKTCDRPDANNQCPDKWNTRVGGAIALGAGTVGILTGGIVLFLGRQDSVAVAFTPRSAAAYARF